MSTRTLGIADPESTLSHPKAGNDILAFMKVALLIRPGVFLGESHDQNMMRDLVLARMKELKAMGITTIYMEFSQSKIDALRAHGEECLAAKQLNASPGFQDSFKRLTLHRTIVQQNIKQWEAGELDKIEEMIKRELTVEEAHSGQFTEAFVIQLITEGEKHGIRIIGHDVATMKMRHEIYDDNIPELERNNIIDSSLDPRAEAAAQIINATRDIGKFLILGGSSHSRKAGEITEGAGLPQRLGIASILFHPVNTNEPPFTAEKITLFFQSYSIRPDPEDPTIIHIPHREGFTFSKTPAYPRYTAPSAIYQRTIPEAMLSEPECQADATLTDPGYILSPPSINQIIRDINAQQQKR